MEPVDLVVREPLPVRAHGGAARRERRGGHREHRHRRAHDDPRGGEEPRVLGGGGQAGELRRGGGGDARVGRQAVEVHARGAGARGVHLHGALRLGDLALVRASARTTSRRCTCAPSRRCSTSPTGRTRTSAPPTTRRLGERTHLLSMVVEAARQGAVVQQPARRGLRPQAGGGVRGAGLRDRQAQQPVRRGARRRRSARRTTARSATDPTSAFGGVFCFNRKVDRELAEKLNSIFIEVVFAPGLRRGRARDPHAEGEHPHPRGQRAAPAARERARPQARARRPAGAGPRRRPRVARRDAGGHASASPRGTSGRTCSSRGRCASTCARTRS